MSETKRCKTCGKIKPVADFYRGGQSADGYRAHCRDCWNESGRVRRLANIDEALEREQRYREDNREVVRERNRLWARENVDQVVEYQRQRTAELKTKVFAHYGTTCACCGTDQNLSIDHIKGDGREHREEVFGYQAAGRRTYLWLIKNGFPGGFQTLCKPCNTSKLKGERCRMNHGEGGGQLVG